MDGSAAETDVRLVSRVRAGEHEAFDLLVKRHHGVVFAVALARLRDTEAAEDLAQEVFLRLYLQIDTLRDGALFGAWAVRSARNLVSDWQRRSQRASRVLPLLPLSASPAAEPADPGTGVVDAMQREDERRLLWRELDRLSPEQRESVLLHFIEGLSKREVAERLSIHPSTAGRLIDRALDAMRDGLGRSLRDNLRSPALRARGVAKTMATIAVVAALPSGARAELLGAIASAKGTTVPSSGFLAQLLAKLATGVVSMGIAKTATIGAVAVIGLLGIGAYVTSGDRGSGTSSPSNSTLTESGAGLPPGWSVRIRNATGRETTYSASGNSFSGENVDLRAILRVAWKVTPGRIQMNDAVASSPKDFMLSGPKDAEEALFQKLLREQVERGWGIRVHMEKQLCDVLILRAPQGRPQAFANVPPDRREGGSLRPVGAGWEVRKQGLGPFVEMMEGEVRKPVFDETGMQGVYDYRWTGKASDAAAGLGLQLTPARREVEILVVESGK